MGLINDCLAGPIAVDTVTLIYFIERSTPWDEIVYPLFESADRGELELVTSSVSLLEVLVQPYRLGNDTLAQKYEYLLTSSRGLRIIDADRQQMREAARLSAHFRLRAADALQIAAAFSFDCKTFVTNDHRLPTVPGLRVLQLDAYRS